MATGVLATGSISKAREMVRRNRRRNDVLVGMLMLLGAGLGGMADARGQLRLENCRLLVGSMSSLWWSNSRILTIRELEAPAPKNLDVEYMQAGQAHPLRRLTAILEANTGCGDWVVSPNGRWLLGIGFDASADGHSGSKIYFAVNLQSLTVRKWPRLGQYTRLVWSSDSESWFDVFPSHRTEISGLQFFLNTPYVRQFPLNSSLDARIIADEHRKLLVGSTQTARDNVYFYRWLDIPHPKMRLPQGVIALPAGYHIVDVDYAPATQRLCILAFQRPKASDEAETRIGYFIVPMTCSHTAKRSSFHSLGAGSFQKISFSPDGQKLLLCSDTATMAVALD